MLDKYNGGSPRPGGSVVTQRKTGNLMMSPFKFKKYGDSGLQISELWPNVGGIADEICMINSLYAEIPNHEPCLTMMNTGSNIIGRPSMGAWITYGLGLENQNLPGYVVLCPSQPITIGTPLWSAGFLPAMHQGTYVKNEWIEGEPFEAAKVIPNVTNSAVSDAVQQRNVAFLRKLNNENLEAIGRKDSQLDATIKSMETAYRMQTEAPQVFDVSKESKATLDMYGPGSTALGKPDGGSSGGKRRAYGAGVLRQGRPVGCPHRYPVSTVGWPRIPTSPLRPVVKGPEAAGSAG